MSSYPKAFHLAADKFKKNHRSSNMKCTALITIILSLTIQPAFALCDLTHFRWDCELTLHTKPTQAAPSLVQCGRVYGYVSRAQYDDLVRFQRANVDMNLIVNDDYVDGPCIPAGR